MADFGLDYLLFVLDEVSKLSLDDYKELHTKAIISQEDFDNFCDEINKILED